MNLYYTGVGSRSTPTHILQLMHQIGIKSAKLGYILRSGGALGADRAFQSGCDSVRGRSKIYLAKHCTSQAQEIAREFHPAWNNCSEFAKKLHGRNAFQVLGDDLDRPSICLICWTPDGCISHSQRSQRTGGTGTAISIADHHQVKIYNLQRMDHLKKFQDWLRMDPEYTVFS